MSDLLLIHGLTYDHRTWEPLRRHLDPGHRVLAPDLPGHGDAPRWTSYPLPRLLEALHEQVIAAGLTAPVVVGHSAGAIIAQAYAARFPATAVVNLDQMVTPGPFFALVRAAEQQLRGPHWRPVWDRLVAGMGIESLPADAREMVTATSAPTAEILLGYWDEILRRSDEQIEQRAAGELRAVAERGIGYHWVTGSEPPEGYLRWLRSLVPHAAVSVVPGGHFPQLADPAAVAGVLARY